MDIQQVAHLDVRQTAIDGEFIVVFAQAAHHIVHVVAGRVFLSQHGDVVIRAVHGRAHQVAGACVHADIFLIRVFFVAGGRHQRAVRSEHKAPQLGEDGHVAHARGHEHLFIGLSHPFADGGDVVFGFFRAIRNPHAAGEIDERDFRAGFPVKLRRRGEQNLRQRRIIGVGQRVGGKERMQAKALCALLHQNAVCLRELRARHAVFRVLRLIHNVVADGKLSARIVAAADRFRDSASPFQRINQREIIQIDDRALTAGARELAPLRFVGGEHDLVPGKAGRLAEHQLRFRGAIHPASLLAQNPEDERVRRRLHREILLETGIPRKRRF